MIFKRNKRDAGLETEQDFADVVELLRAERRDPTELELDEIKIRAMKRASNARSGHRTEGIRVRRLAVTFLVTTSLIVGGSSAVLAGGGEKGKKDDGKDKDAGEGQYGCPPNTHGSKCKPNSDSKQQSKASKNHGSNGGQQGNDGGGD